MNAGVNRRERSVSFAFFANHGETGMEISEAARRQRGTTSGELEKCLPKKNRQKFQVKTKLSDGLRSKVSLPFDLDFLHVNNFYKKNKKNPSNQLPLFLISSLPNPNKHNPYNEPSKRTENTCSWREARPENSSL